MNHAHHEMKSRRTQERPGVHASALSNAIRIAIAATSIALLTSGTALAQTCVTAADIDCSTSLSEVSPQVAYDPTSISGAPLPSAVTSAVLFSDSSAITAAAPLKARVINSRDIAKHAASDVIGIEANFDGMDVTAVNSGKIAVSTSDLGVADGIFSAGENTNVLNTGSISATGYSWAAGIENQSEKSARIRNDGDISTMFSSSNSTTPLLGHRYGIFSRNSGDGGTLIRNDGTISGRGTGYVTGIFAYDAGAGGVNIINTGDVSVLAGAEKLMITNGIVATTNAIGGNIALENSGLIEASGTNFGTNAIALSARGEGSKATVVNSGTIRAFSTVLNYNGEAVHVTADGDVGIHNTDGGQILGDIGVVAMSDNGDVRIANAGLINTTKASATAVLAYAVGGRAIFTNTGEVITTAGSGIIISGAAGAEAINHGAMSSAAGSARPTVMRATSSEGNALVANSSSGKIQHSVFGPYIEFTWSKIPTGYAIASSLVAQANQGNATASNAGLIEIDGLDFQPLSAVVTITGISATAGAQGNATAANSGTFRISAPANDVLPPLFAGSNEKGIAGLSVNTDAGNATAWNTGVLAIETKGPGAVRSKLAEFVGIVGHSVSGNVNLVNTGSLVLKTTALTQLVVADDLHANTGLDGSSSTGNVSILNNGRMQIDGVASAGAVAEGSGGAVSLKNTGTVIVSSSNGSATGLGGKISGGTLSIANAGIINVTAAAAGVRSAGIFASATDGAVVALNSGLINAAAASGNAYGLLGGGNGTSNLVNTGKIVAVTAIQGGDGDTTISNYGILVGGAGAGAGNDTINNHQGGSWDMSGRVSSFGAGNDNFRNMGFLVLKDSRFDFGDGSNGFSNTGTIKLTGSNLIDMGTTGSARFTNAGLLDFTNGKAGDSLAIAGHFGGVGNINLDVDLTAGVGDWLSVSGVAATGTQQKLNIALLDGMPSSDSLNQPLQLVQVAGNSNPNAFVAGQVLGISPADFLKLDMSMAVEKVAGTKGGNYLLSITPKVAGLNASGTLVSAAAMGVDSLLSSTSGNWRERAAMIHSSSALPGLKGITPWVRGFRDTGGMSSNNMVGNFGQAHSANLNQDNSGSEIGFNLDAGNGFSVGATVAKSAAKQYLAHGYGTDTLQGSSVGMYATWNSQAGTYIDASVRGMQFDAYLDTVAGRQQGQGNAHMLNVESGRTWTLRNGLNVEPQAQFTSTKVSGMNVRGDKAVMQTETSNWQRGRVGVSMWKSYRGVSGWNVTPYGQVNAVHTLNGTLDYNINRDFHGQLNSEGTMAMFKLGLNAAKGRFKLGSALNWQSGNQLDSGLGVQTQLNYAW